MKVSPCNVLIPFVCNIFYSDNCGYSQVLVLTYLTLFFPSLPSICLCIYLCMLYPFRKYTLAFHNQNYGNLSSNSKGVLHTHLIVHCRLDCVKNQLETHDLTTILFSSNYFLFQTDIYTRSCFYHVTCCR